MEEDNGGMEELSFVPDAVSEPRWAVVTEAAHTINLCNECCNEMRPRQGEAMVAASKWSWSSRRPFEGSYGQRICAQSLEKFHHQESLGQIDIGRCRKCQAKWDARQVATR